jgi:hypothetical protein
MIILLLVLAAAAAAAGLFQRTGVVLTSLYSQFGKE